VAGLVRQFVLVLAGVGDVPGVAHHALDVRIVVQVGAQYLQPPPRPVGALEPRLQPGHAAGLLADLAHVLGVGGRVVRVHQRKAGAADQPVGRRLQDRLDAGADVRDPAVRRHDRDDVGRVAHQRPEPVLVAAHLAQAGVQAADEARVLAERGDLPADDQRGQRDRSDHEDGPVRRSA
jgi:hypothetical protein